MATEDIIIRYKADVSQLEQDLDQLVKAQKDVADTSKKASAEVQKSANAQEVAIKKRTELLELERKKLENLRRQQKLAFTPEDIDKFNKEIAESTRRIDLLSGEVKKVGNATDKAFDQVLNTTQRIAGAFGVAFSLEAVIAFGQKSVDAFIEAERSAQLLKDTVIGIGGQSEQAFDILNNQAERYEAVTNQSAEAIKSAQIVLTNYGLTGSQIEQLLPSLLGLAKKTGDSIDGIAQKVGNALEGSGKQFKNLGANIDASKTPLENYNALVEGLARFSKDATLDASNLADAFQLQKNRIAELEETIGGKLAPAWNVAYESVLNYIGAVAGIPIGVKEAGAEASQKFAQETQARVQALQQEGKSTSDIIAFLRGDLDKANQTFDESNKNLQKAEDEFTGFFNTIAKLGSVEFAQLSQASLTNANIIKESAKANVDALNSQILALNDQLAQEEKTLKVQDIKNKKTGDLKILLEENKRANDLASQSNVQALEKEIDAREKASEKARQQAQQIAQARKQLFDQLTTELASIQREQELADINLIEPKTFADAVDKIEQLRDVNKKYIDEDINLKIAQAKAQGTLTKDVEDLFEKIRQGRKDLIDQKAGKEVLALEESTIKKLNDLKQQAQDILTQRNLTGIQKSVEQSGKALDDSITKVEESIGTTQFKTAKESLDKRFILYVNDIERQKDENIKAINDRADREAKAVKESATAEQERINIREKAKDEVDKIIDDADKKLTDAENKYDEATNKLDNGIVSFVNANAQALQYVSNIIGELTNLYDQYAEKRIEQIEAEKEAQLTSIDEQIAKDEELFEKRRITDEQLKLNNEANQQAKIKAEEESAKKINQIKKRQAQLDKANALFNIALNTFQALADVKNLSTAGALTPLILALSALQVAGVLAQPIPYRKGSKDTGASGHMARVGEEGEEIVYMPSHSKVLPARQTKEYSNILDAMFDNKLNSYIAKTYVTPALQRQKALYDNEKQESFASNISKSIYFNGGLNANDLEKVRKKGQTITNVDDIARAIVRNLPISDPYRR